MSALQHTDHQYYVWWLTTVPQAKHSILNKKLIAQDFQPDDADCNMGLEPHSEKRILPPRPDSPLKYNQAEPKYTYW